jgi:hypothetical protein
MLNFVIHYPCEYPVSINYHTVCGSWPQAFKKEIIDGVNGIDLKDSFLKDGNFLTKENVTVLVVSVIEVLPKDGPGAVKSPVLVTLYLGEESRKVSFLGFMFSEVIKKALRGVFGNQRFSVQYVNTSTTYVLPHC